MIGCGLPVNHLKGITAPNGIFAGTRGGFCLVAAGISGSDWSIQMGGARLALGGGFYGGRRGGLTGDLFPVPDAQNLVYQSPAWRRSPID